MRILGAILMAAMTILAAISMVMMCTGIVRWLSSLDLFSKFRDIKQFTHAADPIVVVYVGLIGLLAALMFGRIAAFLIDDF